MDSFSVGESTEDDGRIIPDKVPGTDLIPENIYSAADTFTTVAAGMRTNTESITTLWSGIPAVYEAPTADIVYAAMGPVSTEATTFADKADKVAAALSDFAENIATVKTECDTLRTDAQSFRDEIDGGVWLSLHETTKYEALAISSSSSSSSSKSGSTYGSSTSSSSGSYELASGSGMSQAQGLDYLRAKGETVKASGGGIMILSDWKESSEHVDRNNQLLDRAADLYAKISGFEADCANTINAQRDSCVADVVPVESWMLKQDGEGTVDLPWGHRSEENRNCGESVWHGVGTGAKGFVESLGTLALGYNPQSDGLFDVNVWGPSWVALGTNVGGLILATNPFAQAAGLFPGPFQTVMQKSNEILVDTFKGLTSWDEWSKNPGEAFGQVLFNAATIVVPGPKGLGGLLKGTTIGGKIDEFLTIGTKAADDAIAGAGDLFKTPKFDHPKIDVPDFKDPDIHLDRPGNETPVHGHADGGSAEPPRVDGPTSDRSGEGAPAHEHPDAGSAERPSSDGSTTDRPAHDEGGVGHDGPDGKADGAGGSEPDSSGTDGGASGHVPGRPLEDAVSGNPTSEVLDPNRTHTNIEKSEFGEAQSDAYMLAKGYERIDIPHGTVSHNGIDAIYQSPDGHFVIVEAKFGTSGIKDSLDGRQMSDSWLTGEKTGFNRIYEAVGKDEALTDRIEAALRNGEVTRVMTKIDEFGVVTPRLLDSGGYVVRGATPRL
ncbi:hypothetical protein ITJ38_10500 [Agreia pratensis]|uniref:hypothetical protein n=1 Tax=Agreia pratensis TaxID=150121 RepID=UPI00188BE569|nr:hypothetical protein [Agreia pratensis]MBF4634831.1 hypothetical protein [Agreia pratensis]